MIPPKNSIEKKQIVAVTGFLLVLFIAVHLAGNMLLFAGPDYFNGYVEKLNHLRPLTTIIELILAGIFLVHIYFTSTLIRENIKARGGYKRYAVEQPSGDRSIAAKLMPFTAVYIFIFLLFHVIDFVFSDENGARGLLNGVPMGLYGLVINAFKDPVYSLFYIGAVICVGFHLAHGVQSIVQTFGFDRSRFGRNLVVFSRFFGVFIACGFATIPLYVLFLLR